MPISTLSIFNYQTDFDIHIVQKPNSIHTDINAYTNTNTDTGSITSIDTATLYGTNTDRDKSTDTVQIKIYANTGHGTNNDIITNKDYNTDAYTDTRVHPIPFFMLICAFLFLIK